MKRIEAYIKTHRLDDIIARLHVIDGLTGVSMHSIKGFGRGRGYEDRERIVDSTINWIPHLKLEIFCNDILVKEVADAILDGAHTGLRGDGKIYISNVEDAIRISTKETGVSAI